MRRFFNQLTKKIKRSYVENQNFQFVAINIADFMCSFYIVKIEFFADLKYSSRINQVFFFGEFFALATRAQR